MFKWTRNCKNDGHKYEARYDFGDSPGLKFEAQGITTEALQKLLDAYRSKTYIHDICTRCGNVIQREES